MLSPIRSRLTYANVAVTIALVFAMTGGAFAATHYLLTSTKQISPSVLRALQGKQGLTGQQGVAGTPGAQGPRGEAGPAGNEGPAGKQGSVGKDGSSWPAGGTLPAGKTETGTWAFVSYSQGEILEAVSFPVPTGEPLEHVVLRQPVEEDPSPNCGGTVDKPEADPGFICLYSAQNLEVPLVGVGAIRTSGVVLTFESKFGGGPKTDEGTWAATSP
jgi:hypothetical protein